MGCVSYFLLNGSSLNGPQAVLNTCQPKLQGAYQDISKDYNFCLEWMHKVFFFLLLGSKSQGQYV